MVSTLKPQPKMVPKSSDSPSLLGVNRHVALLTGGDDKTYAIGLTSALTKAGIEVDYIGSDRVDGPELHNTPLINFLNLRGDQSEDVGLALKILRIVGYYWRLIKYAVTAEPRIFH